MKQHLALLGFILLFANAVGQRLPNHYTCYHSKNPILLDGVLDDKQWDFAEWTENFMDISGPDFPTPQYVTKVKMLWSDSFLYVGAYINEPHIWAYITEDEEIMYHDNDFEIFIDPNGDNHNYYEFEFNALNKKWDLFLERPYRDKVIPDLKWECRGLKHATKVYGSINQPNGPSDSAWTMEIAIPIKNIQTDVKDNTIWRINFSRVEWETKIIGEKYVKLRKPENNWVWSPQWAINMHRPEYWGYLQFSEKSGGLDTATTIIDDHWETKLSLMKIYYFQSSFHKKHKKYSEVLPSNLTYPNVNIAIKGEYYIISSQKNNVQWNVNEKGKLWPSTEHKTPRFWVWMHPDTTKTQAGWDSAFAELAALGIHGVLMGVNAEVMKLAIPIAHRHQIQIHGWMWAMNRGDAPDNYLSVNALGKSLAEEKAYVNYYKFMCPALPEVHEFVKNKIAEVERIDGLDGIHLDYIRYVDVILPKGLWSKYNLKQTDIMPEYDYGYHPKMIELFKKEYGKSPYEIPDYSHDSLWQQFRMNQLSAFVDTLSDLFYSKNLKLSAAVFPDPEMSKTMVRQDWGRWHLDYYFPMNYYGFYNADTTWVKQRMMVSRQSHPQAPIFCGLIFSDIKTGETVLSAAKAAFDGGASGISFFEYHGLKSEQKAAIKKLAQTYGEWL